MEKDHRVKILTGRLGEIRQRFAVETLTLFGSSFSETAEGRDIDLAIEGISDRDFFAFYGELLCARFPSRSM
jgi:predicted nucleotidyltransferase